MSYTNLSFDDRLNNGLLKLLWLQRDLADFTAFNPVKFTAQFITDFQTAYQTALSIPSDENMTDIGMEKTEVVTQKMEAARILYQRKIKYFLEEAFGNRMGILNSFGYDNYQDIRTSVSGMISFLTHLEIRCMQEQTALLAVGIANTFLIDIKTAKDELVLAYTDQQTYFGSQKDMTQVRKAAYDALDAFVKEVCRVGKTLYEGINPAKYGDYIIYKIRNNSNVTTQSLAANTESPVLSEGADENINIQLENIGNTDLIVYVNDQLEANATGYTLTINTSTVMTTNALSAGGYGMLIARNANPIEGKLKVKLMDIVE